MSGSGERRVYPSGDEQRDSVIELLCDEWPTEVDYREWDDRCALVVRLLDVLDRNRLTVIDLGEPVSQTDLARLLQVRTHTRTSTNGQGPDYCAECSEAITDWVKWPCARSADSGRTEGSDG